MLVGANSNLYPKCHHFRLQCFSSIDQPVGVTLPWFVVVILVDRHRLLDKLGVWKIEIQLVPYSPAGHSMVGYKNAKTHVWGNTRFSFLKIPIFPNCHTIRNAAAWQFGLDAGRRPCFAFVLCQKLRAADSSRERQGGVRPSTKALLLNMKFLGDLP